MRITEFNVQNALQVDLLKKGHQLICPNYTPVNWYECDLFSVTKSGYFVEHEIKLSVPDFKKDAYKISCKRNSFSYTKGSMTKHERLAAGDELGPRTFYFVVPESIADKIEVPEWAGLKVFRLRSWKGQARMRIVRTDKPSVLHKVKISDHIKEHVESVFYWRLWSSRGKVCKLNTKLGL